MSRKKITIEDLATGEQKTLECQGYLVCAFDNPVPVPGGEVFTKANMETNNVNGIELMALMSNENPLGEAFHALNDVLRNPLRKARWKRAFQTEVKKS